MLSALLFCSAAIPFIVHPIDNGIHYLMNSSLRPAMRKYICGPGQGNLADLDMCEEECNVPEEGQTDAPFCHLYQCNCVYMQATTCMSAVLEACSQYVVEKLDDGYAKRNAKAPGAFDTLFGCSCSG